MQPKDTGTNYKWCIGHIHHLPKVVVEVGSKDALDAIFLAEFFECKVIAFEPNPSQYEECKKNLELSTYSQKIWLRTEALTDRNGPVILYQVDTVKYNNAGSTSIIEINFENRARRDPDRGRPAIQDPVVVEAARYDSLQLPTPELLVMDVEGAELKVLLGFGELIQMVKYVVLEVSPVSNFKGGCHFKEVHAALRDSGFEYVASDRYGAGSAHLRFGLLLSSFKSRLLHPFRRRTYRGMFNALYCRREP